MQRPERRYIPPFPLGTIPTLRRNTPNEIISPGTYYWFLKAFFRERKLSELENDISWHFSDFWSDADVRVVGNRPYWRTVLDWALYALFDLKEPPVKLAGEVHLNTIYKTDCRQLLAALPNESVECVLADPMYGLPTKKTPGITYEWGTDPVMGDPAHWWRNHEGIFRECRRVLKPGGKLAIAQGYKFQPYFNEWFGDHRLWAFARRKQTFRMDFGAIWIVQTKEQQPVRFPDRDAFLILGTDPSSAQYLLHPCPKSVEEMSFLVEELSKPGETILDPFSGTGTTLVAAKKAGRNFIGCDLSELYCRVALKRLQLTNQKGTQP